MLHSFFRADVAEQFVSRSVIGKQLQSFRHLRGGAIVVSAPEEHVAVMQVGPRKEWVQFHRPFLLRNAFLEAPEIRKANAVMSREVAEVWIQFNPASKNSFCL